MHAGGCGHHGALARTSASHGGAGGGVVERAILVERGAHERAHLEIVERKGVRARRCARAHSPTRLAGAFCAGAAPPIDTMRSIARRARCAISVAP